MGGRLLDPTETRCLSGDSLTAVLQLGVRLLCGVLEETELLRGACQTMAVTAPECKISCEIFSRFVVMTMFLLPFWQMEWW
jgi:hypothetical protein